MTATQLLISAIRAQVCGKSSISFEGISPETMRTLYQLSKSQDMAHIVATELNQQGLLKSGEEISEKFSKQQMIAIFRYERIQYELEEACSAFEEAKIPFMPLKGSTIRALYPEPWMRTSSDIDILIHPTDFPALKEVMEHTLNIPYQSSWHCEHSFFSPGGVHFEIHDGLPEKEENPVPFLDRPWDFSVKTQDWNYRFEMTDELYYFYHIAHMAKHFKEGGCGIRPFLDLWLLEHRISHDTKKRNAMLKEGNLLAFADAARLLSEVWFGEAQHTNLSKQMEGFLLQGGIYGTLENRVAVQQDVKKGRGGYVLAKLFVPYEKLKYEYPILQSHRWLTPVMEVRRWGRILFRGGLKRSAKVIQINANLSEEQKNNASDLLKQLGL